MANLAVKTMGSCERCAIGKKQFGGIYTCGMCSESNTSTYTLPTNGIWKYSKSISSSNKEDVPLETKSEGVKHDQEKPDLSLLPLEFLSEVSRAMMHGEKKYGRYNYTGGMSWSRIIAASLRHIYAFAAGEDLDPESGVSHLGHAGACILMLTVYYKRGLGVDNREVKK